MTSYNVQFQRTYFSLIATFQQKIQI